MNAVQERGRRPNLGGRRPKQIKKKRKDWNALYPSGVSVLPRVLRAYRELRVVGGPCPVRGGGEEEGMTPYHSLCFGVESLLPEYLP